MAVQHAAMGQFQTVFGILATVLSQPISELRVTCDINKNQL